MSRELASYGASFERMHQQQAALYQQHVREVRRLQAALQVAEGKASGLEARHAEDAVKTESWSTMADALESNGDEGQRKLAMMGRRLTTLRVREMHLARQVASQEGELKGLRAERAERQKEVRDAPADAAQ